MITSHGGNPRLTDVTIKNSLMLNIKQLQVCIQLNTHTKHGIVELHSNRYIIQKLKFSGSPF